MAPGMPLLSLLLLAAVSSVWSITCYECTSSQGVECQYTATSCQYGFFGCVKIAAYSGGVSKSVDMCEQTSILGTRILKCTCFNDYCNSSHSWKNFLSLITFLVFVYVYH